MERYASCASANHKVNGRKCLLHNGQEHSSATICTYDIPTLHYATLHNTYTNRRKQDAKTLKPIVKYLKINYSSDTNAEVAKTSHKNLDTETHTNQIDRQSSQPPTHATSAPIKKQ